jgi:hypothetical protein
MPLDDSEYLDVSITGFSECVDWTECKNATEVMELIKLEWEGIFNASTYNLTLRDFIWGNSTYATALDVNCTDASYLIFGSSEALQEAFVATAKYMLDMCNEQPNNVCSWVNVTDGTAVHLKATINMTSMEADETNKMLKRECKNAGGQYVLETFDIGFKSESDYMQYYSVENQMFMPLYDSKYFDISILGYIDCADSTECRNETELSEFIKIGWDGSFNASIYNFTLHNVIWENSTYQ